MSASLLTSEEARDLFRYDPDTGFLHWRKSSPSRARVGDRAGCFDGKGYILIMVRGKHYRAHRLVWLIVNGVWPDEIDHINGVKHDNKIENLRNVARLDNCRNKRKYKNNVSGATGVHWSSKERKWKAVIKYNGTRVPLYTGDDINAACRTRKEAERKYGYHENHGSVI